MCALVDSPPNAEQADKLIEVLTEVRDVLSDIRGELGDIRARVQTFVRRLPISAPE